MTKASLSLHLDDATTYATVYQGEKPVASVRRRRAYGESDRKTWTVYDLDGAELFQTNLGSVTIRSRLSSILKAREEAADPVEVARTALKVAENAMHHARRINAEDVKEREDAYSAAIVDLERALSARNAPKVCDKTHDAVVSVSALALFEAGNVDQAWTLAQLDSGLHAEATKEAWIVWAKGALLRRKEA